MSNYERLRLKYAELYSKHRCFISTAVFNEEYNKNYVKKGEFVKYTPCAKSIKGILNTLNTSNYKKLLERVKTTKNLTNINNIINVILELCSIQAFYSKIYMKFIKDIYDSSTSEEKHIINELLDKYVFESVTKIFNYLITIDTRDESNYDIFCEIQKEKGIISAINIIILELFSYFTIKNIHIHDYCDKIKFALHNDTINEDKTMLVLQMINAINKKTSYDFDLERININENTSKRLIYLLDDIVKFDRLC